MLAVKQKLPQLIKKFNSAKQLLICLSVAKWSFPGLSRVPKTMKENSSPFQNHVWDRFRPVQEISMNVDVSFP